MRNSYPISHCVVFFLIGVFVGFLGFGIIFGENGKIVTVDAKELEASLYVLFDSEGDFIARDIDEHQLDGRLDEKCSLNPKSTNPPPCQFTISFDANDNYRVKAVRSDGKSLRAQAYIKLEDPNMPERYKASKALGIIDDAQAKKTRQTATAALCTWIGGVCVSRH